MVKICDYTGILNNRGENGRKSEANIGVKHVKHQVNS
jgi:hypothetical protein